MNYHITASSLSNADAQLHIKQSNIDFGTTPTTADQLPNPAELFLGSFAACMLKNVERFSKMMKFTYSHAELKVDATWLEKPPRMDAIHYELIVYSTEEDINVRLLQKNIEKFGTIYNTVKLACAISGTIETAVDSHNS